MACKQTVAQALLCRGMHINTPPQSESELYCSFCVFEPHSVSDSWVFRSVIFQTSVAAAAAPLKATSVSWSKRFLALQIFFFFVLVFAHGCINYTFQLCLHHRVFKALLHRMPLCMYIKQQVIRHPSVLLYGL